MDINRCLKGVLVLLGAAFLALSIISYTRGAYKILFISWVSLLSMGLPMFSTRTFSGNPTGLVWAYGVSSGAMILSAVIFMFPQVSGQIGLVGLGLGVVLGYAIHTIGHNTSHWFEKLLSGKQELVSLTLHTVFAGIALGLIYAQSPEVSVVLGIAIISHKFPAGFSVVRRLNSNWLILYPAVIFGVICLSSFFVVPVLTGDASSFIFGIAAGVFIHMAMDFLPECDRGEIYEVVETSEESVEEHKILDRLRYHALVSVIVGAVIVVGLWFVA